MFDSYIGDIDHDISVLAMDKILYDNGFSVTDSEIHSDSEYNTFFEALLSMDGYIDEDESDEADCTVMVFRNDCLKRYIGLALKYGSMNGLTPNMILRLTLRAVASRRSLFSSGLKAATIPTMLIRLCSFYSKKCRRSR